MAWHWGVGNAYGTVRRKSSRIPGVRCKYPAYRAFHTDPYVSPLLFLMAGLYELYGIVRYGTIPCKRNTELELYDDLSAEPYTKYRSISMLETGSGIHRLSLWH